MTDTYAEQKAKLVIRSAVGLLQKSLSQNDWTMVKVYAYIIEESATDAQPDKGVNNEEEQAG